MRANAGSGKTTAISERLAAIALTPEGGELLRKTAVVTFTNKAAAQIGQRARAVLLRRLTEAGRIDLAPLDQLERAFFGTIHSFCLLLAQRHGQALGLNLNPAVVAEDDEALWEEFLEQDAMQFAALAPAQVEAFLRHAPLDSIFELARRLDHAGARRFAAQRIAAAPPEPSGAALQMILAAKTKGRSVEALKHNQETAAEWSRRFRAERSFLPIPRPQGTAANIEEFYAMFFAPVKAWLAEAGAALAGELALRYRAWRFDRGVQTYADQVESALAVLHDAAALEKIRAEGWRVILDEAQDTDPQQFAVLVEITRPPEAELGTWPVGDGPGPRPGHFCMVGDGQQAIYGSRADIRNFQKHLAAFARGDGGELLTFEVTFRAPHRVIELLNATLPAAFGDGRDYNTGLPPAAGAPAPRLQVDYEPLAAGPENAGGAVALLPLAPAGAKLNVEPQLAAEARQLAAWLRARGPAGVGARNWGEVCVLAPRNEWLITVRKELEAAGLKTALQMRKNRNGDNPAYAWMTGLLATVCDPDNTFEWVGVLREVFGVSDALLAEQLRTEKRFRWDEPERYPEPLAGALRTLRPFIERTDAESEPLERFARDLAAAGGLEAKARLVDPSRGLSGELARLLAQAAEFGLEGKGPRAWLRELLEKIEEGRPAGKPSEDAINLLTSHSAKGLEWPVVIPVGLWRTIGKREETGLRLVADPAGGTKVFFDNDSLPDTTRESRERERLRELVRLLYVTLTRARQVLVLPWSVEFAAAGKGCFMELWGADLKQVPRLEDCRFEAPAAERADESMPTLTEDGVPATRQYRFPQRVLPHQLAHQPDIVRASRHESAVDDPAPRRNVADPLDYGKWWHETMEFLPWRGDETSVQQHMQAARASATERGFGERGDRELDLLLKSEAWHELRAGRWEILTEVGVTAPLRADTWVDGVIDLVAHDPGRREVLVVDWKTNHLATGESPAQLLGRLQEEYRPQLEAYRTCLNQFFPGARLQVALHASGAGCWVVW
ncbi:MAG: UvrD-helicase domain-containing protein [Opitutae bacterium]|nr:UvrD-helicase domain-containing protein [Opitutae bacterium]